MVSVEVLNRRTPRFCSGTGEGLAIHRGSSPAALQHHQHASLERPEDAYRFRTPAGLPASCCGQLVQLRRCQAADPERRPSAPRRLGLGERGAQSSAMPGPGEQIAQHEDRPLDGALSGLLDGDPRPDAGTLMLR